ncbi:MAG: S41 family peptidase [Candidatus Latescibacterota bacterium]|nr:S41 family peptidase [Candidatus Latescibacterota bacterium]
MTFEKWSRLNNSVLKMVLRALLIPLFFSSANAAQADPYQDINRGWDRLGAVLSRIVDNYYADIENADIMQAAIEGMVDHLDSHSQFYDEAGMRKLRQDTTGKYAGLGITVAIKDSFPIIISTMEETPAWRAGIRSGDLIVSIEGLETKNMSLDDVVHELRGDPGSVVNISLVTKIGAPERAMSIKRQLIRIYSVAFVDNMEPNIGYISMRETRFSETTAGEVKAAVINVLEKGAKSLILDLRGNPGGLLNQATQVADIFLPEGVPIVSIRERGGRHEDVKRSKYPLNTEEVPLVVLIDESSASASEIVAGAIQDNDCGIILGTTSFGKGSVQTIFDLNESIDSALKLTTALYYTPSGRSIHREFSGINGSFDYISLGDHQISAKALLGVLRNAKNEQGALSSLQLLFGLDASTAQNLLSMSMRDLINVTGLGIDGNGINESTGDSVYFTKGGRKVYGGGGIHPDIYVELSKRPKYVMGLERQRVFFDFVVDFLSAEAVNERYEAIVDEVMLDAFAEYIVKRKLEEKIEDQQVRLHIDALVSFAGEFGWSEVVDNLEKFGDELDLAIKHGLMTKMRPFISAALKRELVLRSHGKKALIKHDLLEDNQFGQAIEILADREKYKKILAEKVLE